MKMIISKMEMKIAYVVTQVYKKFVYFLHFLVQRRVSFCIYPVTGFH